MNRSEQNDNLSVCNGLTRKESVDINVVDENWMTQTLVETDASDLNEVEHQTESKSNTSLRGNATATGGSRSSVCET